MSDAIAFLQCSRCLRTIELRHSNTDAHRYTEQPEYDHLRARCECHASHFVWPGDTLNKRAVVARLPVRSQAWAPGYVIDRYFNWYRTLPIVALTEEHKIKISGFAAALAAMSPERVMEDLHNTR